MESDAQKPISAKRRTAHCVAFVAVAAAVEISGRCAATAPSNAEARMFAASVPYEIGLARVSTKFL